VANSISAREAQIVSNLARGTIMTADTMMAITEMAQRLVDQFGIRAMLYVDHQVKAALDHGDRHNVQAWRRVGSDVEKLLSPRFFNPYIGSSHSVH
jgi:hypothetical protein